MGRDRMLYNITIMTKLSDLINQYCPDGVEYVKLGEVAEIVRGKGLSKSVVSDDGDTNVILYGELYTHYDGHAITSICSKSHADCMQNSTLLKYGDIIMPITSTTKEAQIGIAAAYLVNEDTYLGGDAVAWRHKQNPKYLMYLMNGAYFEYEKMQHRSGTTVSHLSPKGLANITIPLPPLPVQEKIVEILDKFTALQTALQTELDLRKQQYEYYRDKLLSHEYLEILPGGYREIELGDVGAIRMCKRILKNQTNKNGGIPFYKIGSFGGETDNYISQELFDEYRNKYPYPNKGDLLISAAGTIGKIVVFDGEPSYFQDSNIVWLDNDNSILSNHYLYYLYQTIEWKVSTGWTIARLYNSAIASQKVVIPNSLSEQHRIADILDKFNALATSLIDGLPAEIELRQKQYEYYRDQLLTFKQKH